MKSIRRHLLMSLLVGLTLVLSAGSVALYLRARAILTSEFDRAQRAEAALLVAQTEDDSEKVQLDLVDLTLPEYDHDAYYQLRVPDGQTVARSPSLGFDDLPAREGDLVLPNGRPGRAIVVQFVPMPAEEDQPPNPHPPTVTLVVARDRAGLDRTLAGIGAGLLLVGAVVLVATALIVTLAVRRGLAPLDAVGQQAATIRASTLRTRFATSAMPAELRPIAERLNDLLARLDEAFQRERRVTADIAHELRTPIAELRTLAEVGVKWPEEAAFQDALQIAQRMETLVTGLLALARHDAGHEVVAREPVALRTLVDEVWSPLAERARSRQLDVAIDVTGQWQTDPTLLRMIIGNLIGNAVEYASERGRIRVAGNESRLDISNTTDQLTREDLPHLFERFWRKDAARTHDGHSGLGLTLARAATAALGLELSAEMPDAATLRISLRGRS
ncbi:MAG: ATP-binding protein [Gemmataceae bacterium]|nr:ATP-binding protein [Gemmataceae bacterium]